MKDYLTGREISTVIKMKKSNWKRGESGVSQGLVLEPTIFIVYINDMPKGIQSYMSLFGRGSSCAEFLFEAGW